MVGYFEAKPAITFVDSEEQLMSGGFTRRHSWKVSPAEAIRLQEKIRTAVIERPLHREIRLVAGVDAGLSSSKDKIVAAVVLLQMNEFWQPKKQKNYGERLKLVEQQHAWADLDFPYIPGLLSFREAPVVLRALKKLKHRPDVVILQACCATGWSRIGRRNMPPFLRALCARRVSVLLRGLMCSERSTPHLRRQSAVFHCMWCLARWATSQPLTHSHASLNRPGTMTCTLPSSWFAVSFTSVLYHMKPLKACQSGCSTPWG